MQGDPISFWFSDGCAWIKPTGMACHLNTFEVKEFVRSALRRGTYHFMVDLKECTDMDETFMGVLTGIALREYQLKRGGEVRLLGLSPELEERFRMLGLDQLIQM